MSKTKVELIVEEYKERLEENKAKIIGAPYNKNKPFIPMSAIDLAFQAIESLNKRIRALEGKGDTGISST